LKDKAVVDLLGDPELKGLAKSVCPKHSDDLIQEIALLLMEMSDDKWRQINEGGYLRFYVVRTLLNMATSKRSNFAKKYNLFNTTNEVPEQIDSEGYDYEKELDMRTLEVLVDELYWYDKEVLKLWLEEGSYRKVSKKVGIPFKSIGNSVKKSLETIRNNYYGIHLERIVRERFGNTLGGGMGDRPKNKRPI
tara:strand:- start:149 stop:724 length:576 start_codon:yes stop_codon:yes gene_type:complete